MEHLFKTILKCGNPIAHDTKGFFFNIYGANVKNGGKNRTKNKIVKKYANTCIANVYTNPELAVQ